MKTVNTYGIVLIFLMCTVSCTDSKKASAEKVVMEWIGKEVIFPHETDCSNIGKDTLCPDIGNAPYKILVYTDSVGCTSCKLNLHVWKAYMQEIDLLVPTRQVDFIFYFQPKNRKELEYLLKRERLEHPVFIDGNGELSRINSFPEGMEYQCFLLDQDNRVLSIGNPVLNPKIWEIYKQLILSTDE